MHYSAILLQALDRSIAALYRGRPSRPAEDALKASPPCSKVALADSVENPLETSPLCSKVRMAESSDDLAEASPRAANSQASALSSMKNMRILFQREPSQGGCVHLASWNFGAPKGHQNGLWTYGTHLKKPHPANESSCHFKILL